eukprot:3551752-Rhodomonas_salina.2
MRTGLPILLLLLTLVIASCTACSDSNDCAVNAACNAPAETCTCNAGFAGSGVDSSDFYRVDPPYSAHRYKDSIWGRGPGGDYARGRYAETTQSWVGSTSQTWMQIDLGELLPIAGLDIRGGNNVLGWPERFRVQISPNGESEWQWVEDGKWFSGVGSRTARARRMFAQNVQG